MQGNGERKICQGAAKESYIYPRKFLSMPSNETKLSLK
jgi:hypothetical protein